MVDARVGIADGDLAAGLAARAADALVVPRGESAAFLAPWSVGVLAPHVDGGTELADLLARLGLRTLGAFAELPEPSVLGRFGLPGVHAHRLARGESTQESVPAALAPELIETVEFDPPAERVDEAAFAAKSLADQLLGRLDELGLSCTRVIVEAETEHGERLARCWRHDGSLTPATLVTRVRWQLEGWLTATGGITKLCLVPDEVVPATGRQLGFWGGDPAAADHAARALTRVQGMLGPESVVTAIPVGGRTPTERVRWVPWGEDSGTEPCAGRAVAGHGPRAVAGARLRSAAPGRSRRRRRASDHREWTRRTVGGTRRLAVRGVAERWRTTRRVGGTVAARPALVGPAPCRNGTAGSVPERQKGAVARCGRWSSTVGETPRSRASLPSRAVAPRSKPSTTEPRCQTSPDADPRRRSRPLRNVVGHVHAREYPRRRIPPRARQPRPVPVRAPGSRGCGNVADSRGGRQGTTESPASLGRCVRRAGPLSPRTAARRSLAALEEQPRGTVTHDGCRGPEGEHPPAFGRGAGGAAQPAPRHSAPHRQVDPIALHGRMGLRELEAHSRRVSPAPARHRREPHGDAVPVPARTRGASDARPVQAPLRRRDPANRRLRSLVRVGSGAADVGTG